MFALLRAARTSLEWFTFWFMMVYSTIFTLIFGTVARHVPMYIGVVLVVSGCTPFWWGTLSTAKKVWEHARSLAPHVRQSRRGEASSDTLVLIGGGLLVVGMIAAAYIYGLK